MAMLPPASFAVWSVTLKPPWVAGVPEIRTLAGLMLNPAGRPAALIPHGPYGTMTGNLYFCRTQGGPLVTRYVAPERPFHWWPEYRPAAPASLVDGLREAAPVADPW